MPEPRDKFLQQSIQGWISVRLPAQSSQSPPELKETQESPGFFCGGDSCRLRQTHPHRQRESNLDQSGKGLTIQVPAANPPTFPQIELLFLFLVRPLSCNESNTKEWGWVCRKDSECLVDALQPSGRLLYTKDMTTHQTSQSSDIPSEVIEAFLKALEKQGTSPSVVARLRTVLTSIVRPSKQALTEALFSEEPIP